jgi:cell division transport system permease protein
MGLILSILRQTFKQLFAYWHLQIITISSIAVSLSLLTLMIYGLFHLELFNQNQSKQSQILIFLKPIDPSQIENMMDELKKIDPQIEKITYFDQNQSKKDLAELLGQQAIAELEDWQDLFFSTLEITLKDGLQTAAQEIKLKEKLQADQRIEKIKIKRQDSSLIKSLFEIENLKKWGLWLISVWVGTAVAFVIYQLVRLNLYARKQEIEILHLMGASRAFIFVPLILEAVIQSLMASILAIVLIEVFRLVLIQQIPSQFAIELRSFLDFPLGLQIFYFALQILLSVLSSWYASQSFVKQQIGH